MTKGGKKNTAHDTLGETGKKNHSQDDENSVPYGEAESKPDITVTPASENGNHTIMAGSTVPVRNVHHSFEASSVQGSSDSTDSSNSRASPGRRQPMCATVAGNEDVPGWPSGRQSTRVTRDDSLFETERRGSPPASKHGPRYGTEKQSKHRLAHRSTRHSADQPIDTTRSRRRHRKMEEPVATTTYHATDEKSRRRRHGQRKETVDTTCVTQKQEDGHRGGQRSRPDTTPRTIKRSLREMWEGAFRFSGLPSGGTLKK